MITGIRPHGAELVLLRLVRTASARGRNHVIVITSHADLSDQVEVVGATVTPIGGVLADSRGAPVTGI